MGCQAYGFGTKPELGLIRVRRVNEFHRHAMTSYTRRVNLFHRMAYHMLLPLRSVTCSPFLLGFERIKANNICNRISLV